MGAPPASQFYWQDFLGDANVIAMTLEERGAYITLLCAAWTEGGIPSDHKCIARLLHITPRKLERLWPALENRWELNGGGRLTNPRMERIRERQEDFREKAKRAAIIRWDRHANA